MMRSAILSLALGAVLLALVGAPPGQAAVPLAVDMSAPQMVGRGRVGVVVTIAGLEPDLHPTIEGTATVGGQSFQGGPDRVIAARFPAAFDLPAGRVRVGGNASVAEFTPVPPLEENTPVAVEITVRQGNAVATARRTGMLLLPTIIVPGYLSDMAGKPDTGILSAFEQRGYRSQGPSPDLFWFTYPSRSLGLREASQALSNYVREVVLPTTYAARVNVIGYSLGGLLVRWNLAFDDGWDHLVNRFVMVGVPNEGTVLSYVGTWYPIAAPWARTSAARNMLPTFPFWRPAPGAPWTFPPDAQNTALIELNTHPLPEGIRAYAFYGNQQPDAEGRGTWAGVTGRLPRPGFASGAGDGVVLVASALGLPINGGAGVPGLAERLVMQRDLGPVGHLWLLESAISEIEDVLLGGKVPDQPRPSRDGVERAPTMQHAVQNDPGGRFLISGAR